MALYPSLFLLLLQLLLIFPPCHAILPLSPPALAVRDWANDSHNWRAIMGTLQNTGSRIGIPLQNFQSFSLSSPILLEVHPYDLVIIPSPVTPDLKDQLVEVDERELVIFCRGQKRERCKGQEENLKDFFTDLRGHGVRVVVPRGRLENAPVRIGDKDGGSSGDVREGGDEEGSTGTVMAVYETKPDRAVETPEGKHLADLGETTVSSRPTFQLVGSKMREALGNFAIPN